MEDRQPSGTSSRTRPFPWCRSAMHPGGGRRPGPARPGARPVRLAWLANPSTPSMWCLVARGQDWPVAAPGRPRRFETDVFPRRWQTATACFYLQDRPALLRITPGRGLAARAVPTSLPAAHTCCFACSRRPMGNDTPLQPMGAWTTRRCDRASGAGGLARRTTAENADPSTGAGRRCYQSTLGLGYSRDILDSPRLPWSQSMNTSMNLSDKIIKIRDVMAMTGLSRSSIYSLIKAKAFPGQVKLSTRSSGWFYSEVKNWVETRPRAG